MSRLNLARYRIEKAREILKDAEDAIERAKRFYEEAMKRLDERT